MQNKKYTRIVVAIVIFSMMAIYGSVPGAKAVSLESAKDTLSTSAPAAVATHTITIGTNVELVAGGTIVVDLAAGFDTAAMGATCPAGVTDTSTSSDQVTCTFGAGLATSTAHVITLTNVVNPAVGVYSITINTTTDGSTAGENATVKVAVVDSVTMSAKVDATLTFTIGGLNAGVDVNGITTTATSTATTTPFGTLAVDTLASVGQSLAVTTNAANGYVVTVQQDDELTNAAGANINSFNNAPDGSGSTTPGAWANPGAVLDSDWTYGHMGLSSDDDTVNGVADFSGSAYAGLNGTAAMAVMAHDGVSDGSTADIGAANVVYSVRVSALQQAGDYSSTLTYICTPTY